MPKLYDVQDFKIFVAIKKIQDDGYGIIALPQPLSVQYETDYTILRKEYIIEWQEDINQLLYSDKSNFLIVYKHNVFDKKIDIEVLHVFSFDYSTHLSADISTPITYKYRCVVDFLLMPDEATTVDKFKSYLNDANINKELSIAMKMALNSVYGLMSAKRDDHFKSKVNKLHYGNSINVVTVDELQNESDNMNNTLIATMPRKINAAKVNAAIFCGASVIIMPQIVDVYYNAPHTTVKWSDGTTTTVAATNGEDFNKEIGLAMAISRKYCERMGIEHPRAGFKHIVDNAHDQTAKTAARKAYKNSRKLLKEAKDLDETEASNGQHTDI